MCVLILVMLVMMLMGGLGQKKEDTERCVERQAKERIRTTTRESSVAWRKMAFIYRSMNGEVWSQWYIYRPSSPSHTHCSVRAYTLTWLRSTVNVDCCTVTVSLLAMRA